MLPSIFSENLFDDFFNDNFGMFPVWNERSPLYGKRAKNLMKTDVRETEDTYELDIDLPGFKKDEVTVDLKDGCLTISAAKGLDKEEQDKKGRYIPRSGMPVPAAAASTWAMWSPRTCPPSLRTASCVSPCPRSPRRSCRRALPSPLSKIEPRRRDAHLGVPLLHLPTHRKIFSVDKISPCNSTRAVVSLLS